MSRLIRLGSTAVAFVVLGLILALTYRPSWTGVRGGLTWLGWYTLALQVVTSVFLLVFIDDLRPGGRTGLRWARNGDGPIQRVLAEPVGLARGLFDFYRVPFVPAYLLFLGLGLTVSAIAQGGISQTAGPHFVKVLFTAPELALTAIWLLGALIMLIWGRYRGFLGFVCGFASAVMIGDLNFASRSAVLATLVSWSSSMAAICVLGGVIFYLRFQRKVRRLDAGPA
jgi:hypothetical protein